MLDPNSPVTRFVDEPKLWCRIDGRSPRRCCVDVHSDGEWTARVDCLVSELDHFIHRLGGPVDVDFLPSRIGGKRRSGRARIVRVSNEAEHGASVHLRGATKFVLEGE